MSYTKIQRLKKELDRAISENDFDLALESVNDMIKLDHDNDQYWNSRGVILSKLGKIEDSLQAFDQALELNQNESRIWYSKGCVLMENGKPRAALACFYKALDCNPSNEKAKERFNRCIDDLVLLEQTKDQGIPEDEISHKAPEGVVSEEQDIEEEPIEITEPKARKKKGTYLDEDMFSGEEEEEESGEDMEEDWGDDEEEEWEDDEEEEWEDEGEEGEMEFIICRCGEKVLIGSDKRPYRFKCKECGRAGTLK